MLIGTLLSHVILITSPVNALSAPSNKQLSLGSQDVITTQDLPQPDFDIEERFADEEEEKGEEAALKNVTTVSQRKKQKKRQKNSALKRALKEAARKGMEAMTELYDSVEPAMKRRGEVLRADDPAAQLSMFSAPLLPDDQSNRAAYAALYAAKKLKER